MNFSTPVTDFGKTFHIEPQHNILILGSCFANVVGKRLIDYRMHAMLNPTGTIYNPKSIFTLLNICIDIAESKTKASDIASKDIFQGIDGKWYSWMAASLVQGNSAEECAANFSAILQSMAESIRNLDILILTFGTDHYYSLKDSGIAIANCHKMPGALFCENITNIDEITELFDHTNQRLQTIRPDIKIIATVSPYRYIKYGLHQSQLSKARLLLSIEACQHNSNVHYFPAYEILNDELRDYRFYAPDMVHPSEICEEYIWQKFRDNYICQRLQDFFKEWTPILKAQAHKPQTDNTDFYLAIDSRINNIRSKFPEMF